MNASGWNVWDSRISVEILGKESRKADQEVDKDSQSVSTFGLEGAEMPDESASSGDLGQRKLFLVHRVHKTVLTSDLVFGWR